MFRVDWIGLNFQTIVSMRSHGVYRTIISSIIAYIQANFGDVIINYLMQLNLH
jgi:hypothetical protein